ncbi:girdin [Coccinella septempunctata]|uniref:girdin n=1 Tax=Coccinella septempunctata TaxID=41139 RepID=UPI001D072101|nr:girdin [Coccinella septempunctata]
MMDPVGLDPYEQQLLAVFNGYDYDNVGSLDEQGLKELCQTLQLQEQGTELISNLLKEPSKSRVKFLEFKDALLTLLGNMQNNHSTSEQTVENECKGSPEREVSPKYIYGSKKYGRRSRPKTDLTSDEQNDLNYLNTGMKGNKESTVQRSNSEVSHSKKRKTNFKLKRCTSLPSREDCNPFQNDFLNSDSFSDENEPIYTEEMLRKAWKNLGVGKDGYLNQSELILVCDAIGLHNLASAVIRQLSQKSSLDYNQKISFQELLEALKHDDTWADVLNNSESIIQNHHSIISASSSFPDSQTFQYISLGPDGNGIINSDTIIDMWESVGITAPKELLHELGFNSRQIKIAELASVLDSGLKAIHESTETNCSNPHISLLQANLTLYQSEIKCLKHILDQLNEEKDKLRNDVVEANHRATLLAQDVDDHHQKIQESTRNQVKLLEQRHSEILKNLSKKFSEEKEELREFNYSLEQKISNLEQESSKLRNDLSTAKKYLSTVETENSQMSCKIADLHEAKEMLQEQVIILENECRKYNELDHENIKPLLEKLNRLEIENGQLRDQSDEMTVEIEALNSEISMLRSKEQVNISEAVPGNTLDESMENAEHNLSLFCASGAKRRNDGSPSKDVSLFNSNLSLSSPRLGKIRKLPNSSEERPNSSESGFSTEVDYSDNSSYFSPRFDGQEVRRLQAKIILLEQILQQNDIAVPSDDDLETVWTNVNNVSELKKRVKCLENIISEIKKEFQKLINKESDFNLMIEKISRMIVQDDILGTKIYELESKAKLFADATTETDNDDTTKLETENKNLEEQNKELTNKCTELENCIDLLRNEYEKCEDYWANKLDEERQIFELEQAQSNEKFADVFKKMREYEEQFAPLDSKLPTIVESYNLEQQFTDLEEEYENFKTEMESALVNKDEEIEFLKNKLTELAIEKENKKTSDACVQIDNLNEYTITAEKMMQLSSAVVEHTSFLPEDCIPEEWKNSDHSFGYKGVGYNSAYRYEGQDTPDSGNNGESEKQAMSWPNASDDIHTSMFPSTSSSPTLKRSAPCRPKRTRKHERDAYQYKKSHALSPKGTNSDSTSKENNIPTLLNMIHNLADRKLFLEQRCRSLILAVRKQRMLIESKSRENRYEQQEFHYMLKQSQEEVERYMRTCKELSEKLMKTDLLVKELYVENSYLIANVQRLEQQNHLFAQCSTNNSL